MPTPNWAQCHIEVHEAPAILEDCFRGALWILFQSAASQSFANAGDISGDYAIMAVTEGATPTGCGYRKDYSASGFGTSMYPSLRVRLRGRDTTPQYRVAVEHTDATENDTGWIDAPTAFAAVTLQLTAGKTVKLIKLYARCNTGSGSAQIDYDYAVLQAQPPLIPYEHTEVDVDLQHTTASSGFRLRCWHDILQGVTGRRYRLEEGAGIKAYDLSFSRGHGTLINGPTWTAGRHGGGLYFVASSSQRVSTGYKPIVAAAGALTIALWIKAASGATGIIVGVGKTIGADWNRVQLNFQATDKVRIYAKDDAANIRACTSVKTIADNQWHHIIAIVDPGKDLVQIYVDGVFDGQTSGVLGVISCDAFDFQIGCLNNNGAYSSFITGFVDEVAFYEKALSAEETLELFRKDPSSGISRAGPGAWMMIYLAAEPESQVYKIIRGRVVDRVVGGEPDGPWLELVGEDQSEILHERTWSREFTSVTEVSLVAGYVVDDAADELYKDVDATSRTIVNNFRNENAWSVLQKLAETAYYASGEFGAHFYVDPGGCFRFKKYGVFACPHAISDGSDGSTANILDIQVQEGMKGSPRLVNDVKVVIFEEEAQPRDEDGWTESAGGWSSPDPTDSGFPQSDAVDKVKGTASVKFQTTNPGTQYRMRLDVSDTDISGFDALKFFLKYGAGLSIDSFEVRIQKSGWLWTADYRTKTGIPPPGSGAWHEVTVDIADMTVTGYPGNIVNNIEIKAVHGTQIGTGGFLIDKLHFVRSEKAGTASDSASQAAYGKRTLTLVDKSITSTAFAGHVAANIVANRRHPLATIRCKVPGRGQPGYRPPQRVTVTSLKDGLRGASFQVARARHRYTPGGGYVCDLDLVAAKTASTPPAYSDQVAPGLPDLGALLGEWRGRQQQEALNSLRSDWI